MKNYFYAAQYNTMQNTSLILQSRICEISDMTAHGTALKAPQQDIIHAQQNMQQSQVLSAEMYLPNRFKSSEGQRATLHSTLRFQRRHFEPDTRFRRGPPLRTLG
jgi:hypothetical protein